MTSGGAGKIHDDNPRVAGKIPDGYPRLPVGHMAASTDDAASGPCAGHRHCCGSFVVAQRPKWIVINSNVQYIQKNH
jgi:hypothetical protein